MQKQLLVTVGDDQGTSYSLRFLHSFFRNKCDIRLTLFYVAPKADAWKYADEVGPEADMLDELEAIKRQHGKAALDKARDWIVAHGCSLDFVSAKVVHSRAGTVREIIQEAHEGLYDACVLGRRGISWFETLMEDSITQKILWESIDFPVWICRRPGERERRGVLLCLDERNPSTRVADHVGFMVADQPDHEVTLFHVRRSGAEKTAKVAAIFDEAKAALIENHFPAERIHEKIVSAPDVAAAIMREAEAGRYAVVAVGRNTGALTGMKRFFPGSVSTKLLMELEKAALWVSK